MTETKPATYQTGETITVGDIVRVGNGKVQWRVATLREPTSRYDRGKTSASLDNLDRSARNSTRWVRDAAEGGLVLVTSATDAEREANERKAAERDAELERQANLRAAQRRVARFLDTYGAGQYSADVIHDNGLAKLLVSDVQALLAAVVQR